MHTGENVEFLSKNTNPDFFTSLSWHQQIIFFRAFALSSSSQAKSRLDFDIQASSLIQALKLQKLELGLKFEPKNQAKLEPRLE